MSKNVVVTGIGIISPLGLDSTSTWNSLIEGKSGVDYIGSFDTEQFETHIAAEVKNFNPEDFLDKKEARRMDRFVQFAAVATQEALLNAKIELSNENPESFSNDRQWHRRYTNSI